MADHLLVQILKAVQGIAPAADAFAATVSSAAIKLGKNAQKACALLYKGVGTTGTSTVTVEACSDSGGTGAVAIPFRYVVNTTSDTYGVVTEATAAGFTTSAGSNHIYGIEVDSRDCPDGKPWVRVTAVEVVNDPVLGGILWLPYNFRFNGDILGTVLA